MALRKVFNCIVDDTALVTNIAEIEAWVSQGALTLVVPLHTLERLHLLKKDASQLGSNAREAVKFLDRATSDGVSGSLEPVIVQGPTQQYASWKQVEAHYKHSSEEKTKEQATDAVEVASEDKVDVSETAPAKSPDSAGGVLSQLLLDKLNFAKEPLATSPSSTPPLSPSSSGLPSTKASPEVKTATMAVADVSPVPPSLKPLLNSVVWYMHENKGQVADRDTIFLTNSADTAHLARDFDITSKTIHQLRAAILAEGHEVHREQERPAKHVTPPSTANAESEPKGLFKYEEDDSEEEEEEVVFKPRGRGTRGTPTTRATPQAGLRGRSGNSRSPAMSFTTPVPPQNKPQIPIEEIDPDSFDRGSFGRGSTPLANTGPHIAVQHNTFPRGPSHRGFVPMGPSRGGAHRGAIRGYDRGSARARGRLFVP